MASLLCAAFAKSIELSFTTVFVAFLGQVLTRRAFSERSKGITIAEMSMRSWIMQPGTLLTHWQNVGKAAMTVLGLIALSAAVVATFYTTASDALGKFGCVRFIRVLLSSLLCRQPPSLITSGNAFVCHFRTPKTVYEGCLGHAGLTYHEP